MDISRQKLLNQLLKTLRSNLNESNADRVSKATNNLKKLIESTEESLSITNHCSGNNKAKTAEAVLNLKNEIHKQNPIP